MKNRRSVRTLELAFGITIIIFILEVVGGFLSNSLSLFSDSIHMFFDALSILLTISAIKISLKVPTKKITFGFHRVEIFVALINGALLALVAFGIVIEAVNRLFIPSTILENYMLVIALVGFVANVIVLKKFHIHKDINFRSARYHVLSDTLTSVGVIFGALLIKFTGISAFDSIISIGISVFILAQSIRLIKESTYILLQGAPSNIDIDGVIAEIKSIKYVLDIHHIQLWSLCSQINVLNAHVIVDFNSLQKSEEVRTEINKRLSKYDVAYTTIQFESKKRKAGKFARLNHKHTH